MTHFRKTLFAAALTALSGAALAAAPATAPTASASSAKTTVTRHKHVAKVKKQDAKTSGKTATGSDGSKG
jgi:hypothetical protein